MKKLKLMIMIMAFMMLPLLSNAKKLTEYKASNGITYCVGDTVQLSKGTNTADGSFIFIQPAGYGELSTFHLSANGNGLIMIVKKIELLGGKLNSKVYFTISSGMRYSVEIEGAIKAGEIVAYKKSN